MIYRTAQAGEHSSLVAIHQEAFHDFFLTDLGPRFLGEYYHAVLKNPGSIAVCAVNDEGQLVGFAYSKIWRSRPLQETMGSMPSCYPLRCCLRLKGWAWGKACCNALKRLL